MLLARYDWIFTALIITSIRHDRNNKSHVGPATHQVWKESERLCSAGLASLLFQIHYDFVGLIFISACRPCRQSQPENGSFERPSDVLDMFKAKAALFYAQQRK